MGRVHGRQWPLHLVLSLGLYLAGYARLSVRGARRTGSGQVR